MLLRLPVGSGLSPDLVPKPLLWPEPGALDYAWRDPGQLYESGPGRFCRDGRDHAVRIGVLRGCPKTRDAT